MRINIEKFKNKIIGIIRERVNEKRYGKLNRHFLIDYNNYEYEKYTIIFEEDKIKMINEIVDSLKEVRIKKVIEKVDRKALERNECYEINCNVYSLEIIGEIIGEDNEVITNNIEIPYVTEILTNRLDGVIESTLLWV